MQMGNKFYFRVLGAHTSDLTIPDTAVIAVLWISVLSLMVMKQADLNN